MIVSTLHATGSGPWGILALMMFTVFILGFFLDWLEITLILVPIFTPLVAVHDFGNGLSGSEILTWFGVLIAMNLQMSFITPPFGMTLFFIRGAAGDQITTLEIYRGMVPFVFLQLLALVVVMVFPQIVFVFH